MPQGYISAYQYYMNGGVEPEDANWGSYRYVKLSQIVNSFILNYTGNTSLVNNEPRYKLLFHAKRAIQELNYDAVREIKVLQLDVGHNCIFILPSDYVNWVRISQYKNGVLYPLTQNINTLTATEYLHDNNAQILFDEDGNVLQPNNSFLDLSVINGTDPSLYMGSNANLQGTYGWPMNGTWVFGFGFGGGAYGLNTETANINPTFSINKKAGTINFTSAMAGESCVLEYVSDGMEGGDNENIAVNKMFEAYVYAYIEKEILGSKLGVQEYIVHRLNKKASALLANARIRIADVKPGRLLMSMRGQSKWIK